MSSEISCLESLKHPLFVLSILCDGPLFRFTLYIPLTFSLLGALEREVTDFFDEHSKRRRGTSMVLL